MMKHEFEKLVGFAVDDKCYERIEKVYMCPLFDNLFPNKQAVADYYKKYDMNGFEKLYPAVLIFDAKEQAIRAWASNYCKLENQLDKEIAKNKKLTEKIAKLKQFVEEM